MGGLTISTAVFLSPVIDSLILGMPWLRENEVVWNMGEQFIEMLGNHFPLQPTPYPTESEIYPLVTQTGLETVGPLPEYATPSCVAEEVEHPSDGRRIAARRKTTPTWKRNSSKSKMSYTKSRDRLKIINYPGDMAHPTSTQPATANPKPRRGRN